MQLIFDSVDEVRDFVKTHLKGSRGGKADKDEGEATGAAPTPLAPPTNPAPQAFGATGFAAPAGGATPQAAGPFAAAAPAVAPEVVALRDRIAKKVADSVAAGHNAADALNWFRNECAKMGMPEAANATQEQINAHFLPKMAVDALTNMAKVLGA